MRDTSNRLNNFPGGNRKHRGGIRPADLLDLPDIHRRVMRLLLRHGEMSRADLLNEVAQLPAKSKMEPADLDAAITQLSKENWLLSQELNGTIVYRVNLHHKPGSRLSNGMWGALEQ